MFWYPEPGNQFPEIFKMHTNRLRDPAGKKKSGRLKIKYNSSNW